MTTTHTYFDYGKVITTTEEDRKHLQFLYDEIYSLVTKEYEDFDNNDIVVNIKNKKILEINTFTDHWLNFKSGGTGKISNYRHATEEEIVAYKSGYRYLEDYKKRKFYEVYD